MTINIVENVYHRVEPVEGETVLEKCTGCRICETVCSMFREGKSNPELSGVRVQKLEEKWVTGESSHIYSRNVCAHCGICIDICPSGAISRDSEEGAVVVDNETCIRCKLCVKACPFKAVWFNKEEHKIVKCDLCKGVEGGPKCVEWCPWQLYRYVEVERYAEERGIGIPQR